MGDELRRLLPVEVSGWRGREDAQFSPETLFDHIDGGAEVYRALNVRAVFSRTYVHEHEPDILVDLFDMGTPSDAFGAFHNDTREDASAGVGAESEISDASLFFWKGRFFVSVVALGHTPRATAAVRAIAAHVAGAIPETGRAPDLVDLLPAEGRIRGHLTYVHHWEHLNTRVFISDDNLLGLAADTEGIAARYEGPATLLVVRYPSAARARQGAVRFATRLLGGTLATPVQREGGTWAAVRHDGRLVVVVWEARTRDNTRRLVNAVMEDR